MQSTMSGTTGDPGVRKNAQLNRLRQQLRKKREALADQFDYKMYMLFHFKEQTGAGVTQVCICLNRNFL